MDGWMTDGRVLRKMVKLAHISIQKREFVPHVCSVYAVHVCWHIIQSIPRPNKFNRKHKSIYWMNSLNMVFMCIALQSLIHTNRSNVTASYIAWMDILRSLRWKTIESNMAINIPAATSWIASQNVETNVKAIKHLIQSPSQSICAEDEMKMHGWHRFWAREEKWKCFVYTIFRFDSFFFFFCRIYFETAAVVVVVATIKITYIVTDLPSFASINSTTKIKKNEKAFTNNCASARERHFITHKRKIRKKNFFFFSLVCVYFLNSIWT